MFLVSLRQFRGVVLKITFRGSVVETHSESSSHVLSSTAGRNFLISTKSYVLGGSSHIFTTFTTVLNTSGLGSL